MTGLAEPGYYPLVEPTRPAWLPWELASQEAIMVPMRPRRHAGTNQTLRRLQGRFRAWASFAVSDHTLRTFAQKDPFGLAALGSTGGWAGATTMDVPFYAFFTPVQQARALAKALYAQHHGARRLERLGVRPLLLIKGLEAAAIDVQLDAAADAGYSEAAFYCRESILEHDMGPVRAFMRSCRQRHVRPVLLGAARPGPPAWGPFAAVAMHHAVRASRRQWLAPNLAPRPLEPTGFWSSPLHRWVRGVNLGEVADHNLFTIQRRFQPPAQRNLAAWGA